MWLPFLQAVSVLAIGTDALKHHKRPLTRPIVGGTGTDIHNFPYQVSLEYFILDEEGVRITTHFCGGSIIGVDWVLSAAHCFINDDADEVLVRIGSSIKEEGGQIHKVSRIIMHPKYVSSEHDYDIALLKVSQPFAFSDDVKPIKLNKNRLRIGSAVVTGWGAISEEGELLQNLMKVEVPLISQWECRWYYGQEKISDNMLCAGSTGLDSCQGDSGGPIVSHGRQIGIVSWGTGCGRKGFPGVYTNVRKFRNWIQKNSGV